MSILFNPPKRNSVPGCTPPEEGTGSTLAKRDPAPVKTGGVAQTTLPLHHESAVEHSAPQAASTVPATAGNARKVAQLSGQQPVNVQTSPLFAAFTNSPALQVLDQHVARRFDLRAEDKNGIDRFNELMGERIGGAQEVASALQNLTPAERDAINEQRQTRQPADRQLARTLALMAHDRGAWLDFVDHLATEVDPDDQKLRADDVRSVVLPNLAGMPADLKATVLDRISEHYSKAPKASRTRGLEPKRALDSLLAALLPPHQWLDGKDVAGSYDRYLRTLTGITQANQPYGLETVAAVVHAIQQSLEEADSALTIKVTGSVPGGRGRIVPGGSDIDIDDFDFQIPVELAERMQSNIGKALSALHKQEMELEVSLMRIGAVHETSPILIEVTAKEATLVAVWPFEENCSVRFPLPV